MGQEFKPYPGLCVLYRWRPGQVRAGQQDAGAMVTKVYHDGTVDLTVFQPGTPDVMVLNRIGRMSQEVESNCWHLPAWISALLQRVDDLEVQNVELSERLDALEGGPRKQQPARKAG